MSDDEYQRAIDQLTQLLNLPDEAIDIAEGWALLPDRMQRHVKILIDDYIASQIPQLRQLYENSSYKAQIRFNRIAERVQNDSRGHSAPDDE